MMTNNDHALLTFNKDGYFYAISVVDADVNYLLKVQVLDGNKGCLELSKEYDLKLGEKNVLRSFLHKFCLELMQENKSYTKYYLKEMVQRIIEDEKRA